MEYAIINIIFSIPIYDGRFEYSAVRDFCKWNKLKPASVYVPLVVKLLFYYIKLLREKNG